MAASASKRLFKEYKSLSSDPPEGITAGPITEDDMFLWEALIQGPEGTPFEGGVFPAELKFPKDYPLAPPKMKFLVDVWHPNGTYCTPNRRKEASGEERWWAASEGVGKKQRSRKLDMRIRTDQWVVYPNGEVCISILHPPGDDPLHYEKASERWSPIQSVEKILISVMSMLAEPNDESPANVDAARMWREKRKEYEDVVRANVRKSLGL